MPVCRLMAPVALMVEAFGPPAVPVMVSIAVSKLPTVLPAWVRSIERSPPRAVPVVPAAAVERNGLAVDDDGVARRESAGSITPAPVPPSLVAAVMAAPGEAPSVTALPVIDASVRGAAGVPITSGLWPVVKSVGLRPPAATSVPVAAPEDAAVDGVVGRLAAY